jgi:hypothetical protein
MHQIGGLILPPLVGDFVQKVPLPRLAQPVIFMQIVLDVGETRCDFVAFLLLQVEFSHRFLTGQGDVIEPIRGLEDVQLAWVEHNFGSFVVASYAD